MLTLISLLFIVLVISLIIVGIISFIAHAFKIKLSNPAIFMMIGIIAISLVFIPIGFVTFYGFGYKDYKISNEKKIVSCDNGGKISVASYGTDGGDNVNYLVYYENKNKKVFLNHVASWEANLGNLLKENNSIFIKGIDSFPRFGKFSILPFMQKEQFDIINEENYLEAKTTYAQNLESMKKRNKMYGKRGLPTREDFNSSDWKENFPYSNNSLSVTYINPEIVSRDEYSKILDCAKKAYYGKKHDNYGDAYSVPDILIYTKNIKATIIPYFRSGLVLLNSGEFDSFQCKDKKYTVDVFLNGLVVFNFAADTSHTNDNFYNFRLDI